MNHITPAFARKWLSENTAYPDYWINGLTDKKALAIYFSEKKKRK